MTTESTPERWRFRSHLMNTAIVIVAYVLSSGPLLGLAFWLRERTGLNQFYAVMWLYYPILRLPRDNPIDDYIEWWVVSVFRTVGPG
jgi:hypothetical protein